MQGLVDWLSDTRNQMLWHRDHVDIPIYMVAAYLAFIFTVPGWMAKRKAGAFELKGPLALWNLSLAIFSILGAINVIPVLYGALVEKGFRYTLCASPFMWSLVDEQPSGLWICLFIYSKFPELIDTVFLILRKRSVIFLHWYHHVTVLLFCWHCWHTVVGYGIWFGAMNYAVHSIMYTYFFCTNIGLAPVVRPFAPVITALQIVQMVFGIFVLVFVAYIVSGTDNVDDFGGIDADVKYLATLPGVGHDWCFVDRANLRMGLVMYFSYFVLFASLFVDKYIRGVDAEATPRAHHSDNKNNNNSNNNKNGNRNPAKKE